MSGPPSSFLAPAGYLWCRGAHPAAGWHLLRAGELVHEGRGRQTARSVCGLWASVQSGADGWYEVAAKVALEPGGLCEPCLRVAGDTQRRDRLVSPPVEQGRLF